LTAGGNDNGHVFHRRRCGSRKYPRRAKSRRELQPSRFRVRFHRATRFPALRSIGTPRHGRQVLVSRAVPKSFANAQAVTPVRRTSRLRVPPQANLPAGETCAHDPPAKSDAPVCCSGARALLLCFRRVRWRPVFFPIRQPVRRVGSASGDRCAAPPGSRAFRCAPCAAAFGSLPVATRSPEARKLLEQAIEQYENVELDTCLASARKATEQDPQFALAYAVWSFAARRDEPAPAAIAKANQLAAAAPAEERLLVHWMTATQSPDLLPAIQAMNDLLTKFP